MAAKKRTKKSVKKKKSTTFKRKRSSNKPMARKSSRRSRVRTVVRRVGSRKTGSKVINTVKPMAQGIGGGMIGEQIAVIAGQPQLAQIGGYGGAFAMGGTKGVIGKVIFDVLSGKGVGLGGLFNSSGAKQEFGV